MNRLEQRLTPAEELASYYFSDKPGKKIWFTRRMRLLSKEEQEEVWKILESRGHPRFELPPPRTGEYKKRLRDEVQSRIVLTPEEWETLTQRVWELRCENPEGGLVPLVGKAMEVLPANRQRTIKSFRECQPVLDNLRQKDLTIKQQLDQGAAALQLLVEEKQQLETRLNSFEATKQEELRRKEAELSLLKEVVAETPDRDMILHTLTDEEVLKLYRNRVLNLVKPNELIAAVPEEVLLDLLPLPALAGHLVQQGLSLLLQPRESLAEGLKELASVLRLSRSEPTNGQNYAKTAEPPKPLKKDLPKVAIIGGLEVQQRRIEEALKDRIKCCLIDNTRQPNDLLLPNNLDLILVLTRWVSHSQQDAAKRKAAGTNTKVILCDGAITKAVREIERFLTLTAEVE